jgi:phosphatidylserine decarboxylase
MLSLSRAETAVARGQTFGMIRIGSQVDLIAPWREGFHVRVLSRDKVVAGETVLVGFENR